MNVSSESAIFCCTSIQAPFWIIIANHFKVTHCQVYLIFTPSPVSECRWPKLFQLLEQLNEDIMLVLPPKAQSKGYCMMVVILIVGANGSQCEYLQTVKLIFPFDLMIFKSIWPYSYKENLGVNWDIFHGWNILVKITKEICFTMTRLINPVFFMASMEKITIIPIAKIRLMISHAGMYTALLQILTVGVGRLLTMEFWPSI